MGFSDGEQTGPVGGAPPNPMRRDLRRNLFGAMMPDYDPDPPTPDEVADAFRFKYGD